MKQLFLKLDAHHALLLVLFAACGNTLPRVTMEPPEDRDAALISAVRSAWNQMDRLPRVTQMPDVLITDTTDLDTFHDLCRACAGSNVEPQCHILWGDPPTAAIRAASCPATHNRVYGPLGMFTPSNFWRLIVIAPQQQTRRTEPVTNSEGVVLSVQTEEQWERQQRVWPQQREALIVHEAVHWMGSLSGVGPDGGHSDARRWCHGTCAPGNVEGNARAAVAALRRQ